MAELDQETQDDFASIMAQFGLDTRVTCSPEEQFYEQQIAGAAPKIDNLLYWLKHEMAGYDHLLEVGVKLTIKSSKEGQLFDKVVTRLEYARLKLVYYMEMYHLTRFKGRGGPLDLEATVTLFTEHAEVKKIARGA